MVLFLECKNKAVSNHPHPPPVGTAVRSPPLSSVLQSGPDVEIVCRIATTEKLAATWIP